MKLFAAFALLQLPDISAHNTTQANLSGILCQSMFWISGQREALGFFSSAQSIEPGISIKSSQPAAWAT
jgi:hypothetical protein